MKYAVSAPDREDHFEGLTRGNRSLPALHHLGQLGWVMHRLPAPAFHLLRCRSRVVVPFLVVPEDPAVWICHPRQLRHRVGHRSKLIFTAPQPCFGPPLFGEVMIRFKPGEAVATGSPQRPGTRNECRRAVLSSALQLPTPLPNTGQLGLDVLYRFR